MANEQTPAPIPPKSVEEYITRLAQASPQEAVQIAIAERARAATELQKLRIESQSAADLEFDEQGRIVKASLSGLFRLAGAYSAAGEIVPKVYQGNQSACFVACQMAMRLKVDVMAYMQNSYIVHGKPGTSGQFQIAMLNTSGKIRGRVRFRDDRDKNGEMIASTAYAIDAETGEEVSARVDWKMVTAENWNKNNKWTTLRDLMFHYRAGSFLIRQYFPEVVLGMPTAEELDDISSSGQQPANEQASLDDIGRKLGLNDPPGSSDVAVTVVEQPTVKATTESPPEQNGEQKPAEPKKVDNLDTLFGYDPKKDAARK